MRTNNSGMDCFIGSLYPLFLFFWKIEFNSIFSILLKVFLILFLEGYFWPKTFSLVFLLHQKFLQIVDDLFSLSWRRTFYSVNFIVFRRKNLIILDQIFNQFSLAHHHSQKICSFISLVKLTISFHIFKFK